MTRPPRSPGPYPFLCPLQAPGLASSGTCRVHPASGRGRAALRRGQPSPFQRVPLLPACSGRSVPSQASGRLGSLPDSGTHSLCLADTHRARPSSPAASSGHLPAPGPQPQHFSMACHMPCLSVSAESRITGKQTCLTLEQRRFEPCGSTYTWIFFSSERYSTPGSVVGGGTEDMEGQL